MSVDFKIFSVCDHTVYQEIINIEPDLRTIRIPRILSSSNIDLYINGYLISSESEIDGFDLATDDNVQATANKNIPLSGEYPLIIDGQVIDNGRRVSLNNQNNQELNGIYTISVTDGYYSLFKSTDNFFVFNRSKIYFRQKRRSRDDIYEVTYSVASNFCPKCFGVRVINDESYSNVGLINTVVNEEKLLQEVKKGLLTVLGSNPFHRWIGTRISNMVGSKLYHIDSIKANLTQEVSLYLEKYLDIQSRQFQYQVVTDREAFYRITVVDVSVDQYDPSIFTLNVIFQNRTGADMSFEKKIDVSTSNYSSKFFNLK